MARRLQCAPEMRRPNIFCLVFLSTLSVLSWRRLTLAAEALVPTAPPALSGALPSMSLHEALAYARQHQPSLQAARARIEVAKQAASAVRAEWMPQITGTVQVFYGTMNTSTASVVNIRPLDLPSISGSHSTSSFRDAYPSTLAALGARQTIYDFGRLAALGAAADADTAVTKHRAEAEALDVGLQVESLFDAVLAAKAVERAAEDAYKRALLRRDMVKASVERGLRPAIDLTRAEVDLRRFDVGRTRARGSIEVAQALLAAAVGSDAPLLDARGEVAAPDALPPFGAALKEALRRDPALRAALSQLAAQAALTRATLRQWAPSLTLTGTLSGRAGGAPLAGGQQGVSGWLPEVPNWDLGLILIVPLFDGVLLSKRAQSRAQEAVLRSEVDVQRRRVLTDIQRAYTGFHVAEVALPELVAATEAAQKNYDQASARFRAGLSTSVELADAEALRTSAEIELAVGRFEVARARAVFNRSISLGL